MSIGFTQTPSTPNGTEADLIYIVSSSLIDDFQFKYILDVKDATDTTLVKIKQPPNNTGLGLYEISNILHDYMDYDKPFKATQIVYSDNLNVRDFTIEAYWERADTAKLTGDHTGDASKPLYMDGEIVEQVESNIISRTANDPLGILARADVQALIE